MEEIIKTNISTTKNGHNFNRVDFNNPESIRTYGDDIEGLITDIFLVTKNMLSDEENLDISDEMIKNISSYSTNLAKIDNPEEKNPIIKLFNKLLKKEQEEEKTTTTYKEEYNKYLESLNDICTAVENQMKNGIEEFKLKREIVEKISPLVESLDEVIKIGQSDRDEFEKEMKSIDIENVDLLTKMKIKAYPDLLNLFDSKLNRLTKDLIIYQNQIYSYYLQGIEDQAIIESQKEFLSIKPILIAQGSSKAIASIHSKRIKNMQDLNDALNRIVVDNSMSIENNAKAINVLQRTEGISVETLQELDKRLKEGIEVCKKFSTTRKNQLIEERNCLKELNENADKCKRAMLLLNDKPKEHVKEHVLIQGFENKGKVGIENFEMDEEVKIVLKK